MSGFRIEGNTSGNVAEVDVNNDLFVNTPKIINNAGYIASVNEIDSGSIIGTPTRRTAYVSHFARQRTGLDTSIFDYFFTASAQDTGVWKCAFTTMTMTQSGGFLVCNSSLTATTTTGCSLSTWRYFALEARGGLHARASAILTSAVLANQVVEFGLFLPTTTAAPADGCYFRITSAGVQGIINYNGVETTTGVIFASPIAGAAYDYIFDINADQVEFYIDGVLYAILPVPSGNTEPFLSISLPLTFQQRNSGAVTGTQMQFKVGACHVDFLEVQLAMPFSHQQAAEGLTCQQATEGNTMGGTSLYSNALAAGTGTALSATAALGTGLGGQFTAIFNSTTVGNDYIISSYQVPAGTIAIPGRILMITGIKIMSVVLVALVGGPASFIYSLAFGHTAVSLATGESASFATGTTKKPRFVTLGIESFAATAAIGTQGSPQGIYMPFNSPIAVNPGEFVATTLKQLGVASGSGGTPFSGSVGEMTFIVTFDGYWI